jgi:hypothetical protein
MPIGPRLIVLADLDHCEIERAESIANRSQAGKEPGVPRVVDAMTLLNSFAPSDEVG